MPKRPSRDLWSIQQREKNNMKGTIILLVTSLILFACSSESKEITKNSKENETAEVTATQEEDLVEITEGKYKEYYPGKAQLKFEGFQDEEKKRHGKWVFYGKNGKELSMTMYDHGKRHGHTIVRYPNGAIHYYGEYDQDAKTGVWKTYDENGDLVSEVDYAKDGDENNAGTILQPVKK